MKVAVWGLGKHAIKNILPALKKSSELELYGIFSRNNDVVDICKRDFHCLSWSTSEELLKDNEVDIVYLSTPPGLHYEQGLKILNAKKHFWCEKPFTTNLIDATEVLELSERNDLSACEAFMYQYHPHFIKLKETLDKEILGKISKINCTFTLPELENPGYRFKPDLGGSALLDVGSYTLSAILNLFPKSDIDLIDAKIFRKDTNSVDLEGKVKLKIDKDINCFLVWAYNQSYKNEIVIEGDKGFLYTDKIFSKDSNYIPSIVIR